MLLHQYVIPLALKRHSWSGGFVGTVLAFLLVLFIPLKMTNSCQFFFNFCDSWIVDGCGDYGGDW